MERVAESPTEAQRRRAERDARIIADYNSKLYTTDEIAERQTCARKTVYNALWRAGYVLPSKARTRLLPPDPDARGAA